MLVNEIINNELKNMSEARKKSYKINNIKYNNYYFKKVLPQLEHAADYKKELSNGYRILIYNKIINKSMYEL